MVHIMINSDDLLTYEEFVRLIDIDIQKMKDKYTKKFDFIKKLEIDYFVTL